MPGKSRTTPTAASSSPDQLLEHVNELEQQLRALRADLTQAQRLATIGTIASVIAHEYHNLLSPVISYAQMALRHPDDHALTKKALQKAVHGATSATRISMSLLGLVRPGEERLAAPLRSVIDDALGCLARDPEKDGVRVVLEVAAVAVAMPPVHLQQVLLNLFLNALKAMRQEGGELRVTAVAEGALVRLTVSDTGPGIPGAIIGRLFEPFVTHPVQTTAGHASSTTAASKGTGLGLSVCRDLVRAAGGTIDAHNASPPKLGAIFCLLLPKAAQTSAAA